MMFSSAASVRVKLTRLIIKVGTSSICMWIKTVTHVSFFGGVFLMAT